MAVPDTRRSAKALVLQIAQDHGYISEEEMQQVNPDFRRKLEEAFLKKDLMIGSSVITLAKNLYTSKARFIFELLQNSDDNSYTRAVLSGSKPYVSFRVYPRKIVVECNEDGFTRENLTAICSVGKSSKTGAQGYIGEKGIGFKSVFMAAWKAHIQSGAFSFSFTHRSGESGMGMISPIWEDTDDELPLPLTRITLHLHESGDSSLLAKTRETIREQFEELQEAILLFMKNLKRVDLKVYDAMEVQESSTSYTIERPRAHYAILKRVRVTNGTTQEQISHFHVTTHQATNLAKNENRTYSDTEEASRAYSKSQVVLAFPLSESSVPIIKPQDLFVFLPVKPVGFNFIIQADFVTGASRQDIVTDSMRNVGLLDGIASAFVKAILQFCEHDTLRYQWMRYLPDKNETHWSPFWLSLVNGIRASLSGAPVLYGRMEPDRRLIRDLLRLGPSALDENGSPLLRDGDPEQLISQRYEKSDLDLLQNYGLKGATLVNFIEWLKDDLIPESRYPSRMRSPVTTESWHERTGKLLLRSFEPKLLAHHVAALREMTILPLQDGTWVSVSSGPVYFAKVDGMDIPSHLDLRLISKNVRNAHRIALFAHLGVQRATAELVREKIFEIYRLNEFATITFTISKQHLQFLYLTQHLATDDEASYERLAIYDHKSELHRPCDEYMYIANDEPYGPWELLGKTDPGPNPGDGAPGFEALFVHKDYFTDGPSRPPGQELMWSEWFIEKLSLDIHVTLEGYRTIHEEGIYLQQHRPERFLGALRLDYEHSLSPPFADYIDLLRGTEVLCRGNRKVTLKDTYFPIVELEKRVDRFVESGAFFPWLYLDDADTHDVIQPKWKEFLTLLGVGSPLTDLDFALDMLRYSLEAFPGTVTSSSRAKLFELYNYIQAKYREAEDRSLALQKIRELCFTKKCIYIPAAASSNTWALPSQCVWNAPQKLKTKFALRLAYEPYFQLNSVDNDYSTHFFTQTLGITDCTWEIYIDELKALKASDCTDADAISTIYEALDSMRPRTIGISKDQVRNAFESHALVYASSDDGPAWHKVSQCVWSSAAKLRGRVSLNDDYGHLENLFVEFLGVKPVDLLMAIDELKETASRPSASDTDLTDSIWTVNSLLPSELNPPDSQGIVNGRIFLIKNPGGVVTRGSITTEFFVVDREPLKRAFETKVKLLDFTLEHITRLRPFLEWTHLEKRYFSNCVKEITSFHGEGAERTSDPERQIRNRAHALLRVASHFDSPRTRSRRDLECFYEVLRNTEIYEADGISSDLHLSQNGINHVVEGKKAALYMTEGASGLKVYLPRNKDDQMYMFTTSLANQLFEWMMKHPVTQISEPINQDGVNITKEILLIPRSRLHTALDENGVATIDIENIDEEVRSGPDSPSTPRRLDLELLSGSSQTEDEDSDVDILETPASSLASPRLSRHGAAAANTGVSLTPERHHLHSPVPFHTPVRSPATPTTPTRDMSGNPQYIALLARVIAAERPRTLTGRGDFNWDEFPAVRAAGENGLDLSLQFLNKDERDSKVGAAGELYVFEFLSHLAQPLPEFSRANWKSTVRRHVTVHPDYADMAPWSGRETSDITYEDCAGVLTDLFVSEGYLARDDWAGKKPKYFVEVKATTSTCNTPFYMSKAQYQRMRDNAIMGENQASIYVIFRVYHLGGGKMGFKVYLDPEALKGSGELAFTAEKWSVVPRTEARFGSLWR